VASLCVNAPASGTLVKGFTNQRQNRMRAELRSKVGDALGVAVKERTKLDCLESHDVFVVFKAGANIGRGDFLDARPLLRQAVVAACAAFETYLGDKAMSKVGPFLHSTEPLTARLQKVPLTLGEFMAIEERYQRTGWGIRYQVVDRSSGSRPALRRTRLACC